MEATASTVFNKEASKAADSEVFEPTYRKTKSYEDESVYNRINDIYKQTVNRFLNNIDTNAKEIDLFSYDYLFDAPNGEKIMMHTNISCRNGNLYVKDNSSDRIMCIPGPDTLERTKSYLTALYLDMGYVDPINIKVAS